MSRIVKTKALISCAFGFAYANCWFFYLFELSAPLFSPVPLFSHRQKSGFISVFISFRVHLLESLM